MDTFDNTTKVVKDFVSAAEKKGEELVKTSKLKVKEMQIKHDISEKFEKLGKMSYELIKAGDDNKLVLQEVIAEIDELKAKLEKVMSKQSEIKGAVKCPVCGAVNKVEFDHCTKCGEKL